MDVSDQTSLVALGILISGRGTNMEALIRASQDKRLSAFVRVVISNRAGVPGLARALALGVPVRVIEPEAGENRVDWEMRLASVLRDCGVEVVALAGFDRVLSRGFLSCFLGRVVNIHPSLLPDFPGMHAQRQALDHKVTVSGCTVHLVDEGVDSGPILAVARVPVLPGDSEQTLSERILVAENRLYPEALEHWLRSGLGRAPRRGG